MLRYQGYWYNMIVFVTGATGYVGRAVVAEVIRRGHTVRCLVRHPETGAAQRLRALGNVELIKGDLIVDEDLVPGMEGCDAVIHLVGIIAELGRKTFQQIHVEGTRKVVRTAISSGTRRYIHMSALGTRQGAASRYHQTKWAAEQIVRSSGLDWTIFRPSVIHGPGDQFVTRLARMSVWTPFIPVIGPGNYKLQPVSLGTVAFCFGAALETQKSIGEVYDLCGDERLTFEEVVDLILAAVGRRRVKLRIPVKIALTVAQLMECVYPRLFGRPPIISRDQIVMLQEDNVGDPRPAREAFGFGPDLFTVSIKSYLGVKQ
ncbi:MAG: complex I NDUFA9 subunit family protein [Verrucomicrobiae bacterium]|nr:complex I NDUFA9 subunit family protein [Verrucomicrobiae bacterium]